MVCDPGRWPPRRQRHNSEERHEAQSEDQSASPHDDSHARYLTTGLVCPDDKGRRDTGVGLLVWGFALIVGLVWFWGVSLELLALLLGGD